MTYWHIYIPGLLTNKTWWNDLELVSGISDTSTLESVSSVIILLLQQAEFPVQLPLELSVLSERGLRRLHEAPAQLRQPGPQPGPDTFQREQRRLRQQGGQVRPETARQEKRDRFGVWFVQYSSRKKKDEGFSYAFSFWFCRNLM